jgi:hypothetical protein
MCAGVLKASYMRKWMSERLKRRKKTGDGSPKEASNAPEPLQPKYYDNEPAAAPEAAVVESRPRLSLPRNHPRHPLELNRDHEPRAVVGAAEVVADLDRGR